MRISKEFDKIKLFVQEIRRASNADSERELTDSEIDRIFSENIGGYRQLSDIYVSFTKELLNFGLLKGEISEEIYARNSDFLRIMLLTLTNLNKIIFGDLR